MGKAVQALQPSTGDLTADIIPVDYLVRTILGCVAFMSTPGYKFILPYNEILKSDADHDSIIEPNVQYFPYIYQVSTSSMNTTTTWAQIYQTVQTYWSRNAKIELPSTEDYFAPSRSFFKSKIFSKSLSSISMNNKATSDANSLNRVLESASRVVDAVQPFMRHSWIFDHQNVQKLNKDTLSDPQFNLIPYKNMDWYTYIVNYAFGTHMYLTPAPPAGLRNITLPTNWACALYPNAGKHSIIDRQIESVVFSASEIEKRNERMLNELIASLEKPGHALKDKKKLEEWVNDFDASLDDWCHDDSNILKNKETMVNLGHWNRPSESHEEHIRVEVLNDRRVGQSIKQVYDYFYPKAFCLFILGFRLLKLLEFHKRQSFLKPSKSFNA